MAEISLTGDQMLTVLEAVADTGPITVADLARNCQMNRTILHRLLNTLEARSYVRRSPQGFVVGSAVTRMARGLEKDVSAVAKPHMERLAARIGETVVLHCFDKDQAAVVEQALGDRHLVRVQHTPGSRHPLYQGASGWALLAFQDEKTIARLAKRAGEPEIVRARIEDIRSQRYAISHDELQQGVHGLAAPLFDADETCVASLAILVPASRADKLPSLLPQLMNAASLITDDLKTA